MLDGEKAIPKMHELLQTPAQAGLWWEESEQWFDEQTSQTSTVRSGEVGASRIIFS